MVDVVEHPVRLPSRLRELRTGSAPGPLSQRELAQALGVSAPLVASWESERNPALPPEERLRAIARFTVARGAGLAGDDDRLDGDPSLVADVERLAAELIGLRLSAMHELGAAPGRSQLAPRLGTAAGSGGFWHFPDGLPVRIVATRLFDDVAQAMKGVVDYANPWHPNYIESWWNADMDAVVELFGHLRAENPNSDVRFLTEDRIQADDLTGHVVVLGQAPALGEQGPSSMLWWQVRRMELPLRTRIPAGGDKEYDTEFVVTTDLDGRPCYRGPREEIYAPQFEGEEDHAGRGPHDPRVGGRALKEGFPQLVYDVALLARQPNQMNLAATVTMCSGGFSRGTYGAVRTLTDEKLRGRNEQFIRENFDRHRFWMLLRVPVFPTPHGAETLTPDLTRPYHVLRGSG